jgi:predicted ribosomally synthesized peptide with SipW-like signal peptide
MKKTLMSAALMLAFSVTMLLGTTYAWWSETIVVEDNSITTGKLEMTVSYQDTKGDPDVWYPAENNGRSFFEANNWQPGDSTSRNIKIKNDGTIPMAFNMNVELADANFGSKPASDLHLAQTINVNVKLGSRQLYNGSLPNGQTTPYIVLEKGEEIVFTVTLTLPTDLELNDSESMGIYFPVTFDAQQVAKVQDQLLLDKYLRVIEE